MRASYVLRSLVSGTIVYVLAAACGSSDHIGSSANDGGSIDVLAELDALIDGVVDPVKDANAAEAEIVTEKCDKVRKYAGSTDYYVAEHAFAGKSIADLAQLHVLFPTNAGEGYTHSVGAGLLFVRDGGAALFCAPTSSGPTNLSVTFVLPK